MDNNTLAAVICIGLTVLGILITAVTWQWLKGRTRLHWLGWALLPLAVWFSGLYPLVQDFVTAIWNYAQSTAMTPFIAAGLIIGSLGLLMIIVSHFLPSRPKEKKADKPVPYTPPAAKDSKLNVP